MSKGVHVRSKEHRLALSNALKGRELTEEHRRKISDARKRLWASGELSGHPRSEFTRHKISECRKGLWAAGKLKSHPQSEEARRKVSAFKQGIEIGDWNGFISFEPYCERFNLSLKEEIRNRDNRGCVLCGKSEIMNGRRLSVHHIDGDKMQGCNGKKWYLCSLCISCHNQRDTPMKEFLIVSNLPPRKS